MVCVRRRGAVGPWESCPDGDYVITSKREQGRQFIDGEQGADQAISVIGVLSATSVVLVSRRAAQDKGWTSGSYRREAVPW